MITFTDLTKQLHLINDLILSDMVCEAEVTTEEASSFSRHLLTTKNWFSRISWANKKRFLLALLEDVRSAWALSLLLKSLWNCRPKDAVLSVSEKTVWSSYDQVPVDHNRTALPTTMLAQIMKSDRLWFLTLEPEAQAMVLSELLIVAGGPVMWTVLSRAQVLYERYRENQMQNLQECIVVNEPPLEKSSEKGVPKEPVRKLTAGLGVTPSTAGAGKQFDPGRAQKELEANLAAWNSTIKSMKDNLKLEELAMRFNDGTTRKVWKVNRPKPEVIETLDFLQLLPSAVGKRILAYLPLSQFSEYARVNKYWAFLVDEFKAELSARQKIQSDFERLQENMLRHDTSLEIIEQIGLPNGRHSSQGNASTAMSPKLKAPPSMKASEKSAGMYSMRHFINEKLNKPILHSHIPLRNLAELTERLDQRGAADDNLWAWCESILKRSKPRKDRKPDHQEGVMNLSNMHFPCPLMKQCLEVPLHPPLYKDPGMTAPLKSRRNILNAIVLPPPRERNVKRYSLWTRDFSGLYPVYKIPSYQSPV